jgi:hypothetical protein
MKGFIDGETSVLDHMHIRDLELLTNVKKNFGVGRIRTSGS